MTYSLLPRRIKRYDGGPLLDAESVDIGNAETLDELVAQRRLTVYDALPDAIDFSTGQLIVFDHKLWQRVAGTSGHLAGVPAVTTIHQSSHTELRGAAVGIISSGVPFSTAVGRWTANPGTPPLLAWIAQDNLARLEIGISQAAFRAAKGSNEAANDVVVVTATIASTPAETFTTSLIWRPDVVMVDSMPYLRFSRNSLGDLIGNITGHPITIGLTFSGSNIISAVPPHWVEYSLDPNAVQPQTPGLAFSEDTRGFWISQSRTAEAIQYADPPLQFFSTDWAADQTHYYGHVIPHEGVYWVCASTSSIITGVTGATREPGNETHSDGEVHWRRFTRNLDYLLGVHQTLHWRAGTGQIAFQQDQDHGMTTAAGGNDGQPLTQNPTLAQVFMQFRSIPTFSQFSNKYYIRGFNNSGLSDSSHAWWNFRPTPAPGYEMLGIRMTIDGHVHFWPLVPGRKYFDMQLGSFRGYGFFEVLWETRDEVYGYVLDWKRANTTAVAEPAFEHTVNYQLDVIYRRV